MGEREEDREGADRRPAAEQQCVHRERDPGAAAREPALLLDTCGLPREIAHGLAHSRSRSEARRNAARAHTGLRRRWRHRNAKKTGCE